MKMTDKLFRAIMRNLHAYVLLINRDFTVFYTNYYDITGAVKPPEDWVCPLCGVGKEEFEKAS